MIEQGISGDETFSPKEKLITAGRVLYLTKNPELVRRQLDGEQLSSVPLEELLDEVSTDEIITNEACRLWTGKEKGHLANFVLTGLRGGVIKPGEVAGENFQTLVAGRSFARGSSRIHAPIALREAGINIVIADSERIFAENCINLGIFNINYESKSATELLRGRSISIDDLLSTLSPQTAGIMRSGGLLSYLRGIEKKTIPLPETSNMPRPMNVVEKIIAKRVLNEDGSTGKPFVKPGEEYVAIPHQYYGYELQSSPMIKALEDEFAGNVKTRNPEKVRLYNDHTALLLDEASQTQRFEQTRFARKQRITVYPLDPDYGAPAICHTDMIEKHALPGQLILGNDSHTDTLGVENCLAVGKGAIDLAGAIAFDKMVIKVPEAIRVNLRGGLRKGATMKDFMLQFGATTEIRKERVGSGRVFIFSGEALNHIPFDEQTKLTNMSIELLGFSGIVEPNQQLINYLMAARGLTESEIRELMVESDPGAEYFRNFDVDLSTIEPTVSEPGDTQNGKPLSEIQRQHIRIQKAYIGSCTHGTVEDLRQAWEVLKGRKVAKEVKLYIQASSIGNRQEAEKQGYIRDLVAAGAELLPIGCGACMNAGPGSTEEGEIGIFATNRNFPGRTGQGKTYLASPYVVAASAVAGFICGLEH